MYLFLVKPMQRSVYYENNFHSLDSSLFSSSYKEKDKSCHWNKRFGPNFLYEEGQGQDFTFYLYYFYASLLSLCREQCNGLYQTTKFKHL